MKMTLKKLRRREKSLNTITAEKRHNREMNRPHGMEKFKLVTNNLLSNEAQVLTPFKPFWG